MLGASCVVTGKIASNAVTNGKIATGAVSTDKIADDAVTAAKIADKAVTTAKLGATVTIAKGGMGATEGVIYGINERNCKRMESQSK
jgi:hypothetical protein